MTGLFTEFDPKIGRYGPCTGYSRTKKLKYTATEGQNGLIHPFNGNELVTDADHHHSSTQHRSFKPAENTPILACGVRSYHAIEQLLTMPAKDISDHCSIPLGCGLIHSIYGLGELGLYETQILVRSGIRQCKRDTDSQYRHNEA
jgi:hypothetical protein